MKISMRPPLPLLALCLVASAVRADSLWIAATNNEQGMFADKRARNIGDILTVVAQENYTTTQAQEIKTYDKTENAFGPILNNIVNQFLNQVPALITAATGIKAAGSGSGSGGSTTGGNASITGSPVIDLGTENKYNGGGTLTGRLTVSNRTAVTVVDVLPNGNLVVEGRKIVRAGKETQYGYLRGVVRQADVLRDNTVLSTNLADAQVEYIPEGELTEAQKKGWLLKAWDKVKPF
jgi:flagellar L-ring protein precursor FlgH